MKTLFDMIWDIFVFFLVLIAVAFGSFAVYIIADYMDNKDTVESVSAISPPYLIFPELFHTPVFTGNSASSAMLSGTGAYPNTSSTPFGSSTYFIITLDTNLMQEFIGNSVTVGYSNQHLTFFDLAGNLSNAVMTGVSGWNISVGTLWGAVPPQSPISWNIYRPHTDSLSAFYNRVSISNIAVNYNTTTQRMDLSLDIDFSPQINLFAESAPVNPIRTYEFFYYSILIEMQTSYNPVPNTYLQSRLQAGYRIDGQNLDLFSQVQDLLRVNDELRSALNNVRAENNSLRSQIGTLQLSISGLNSQIEDLNNAIQQMIDGGSLPVDVFGWIRLSFGVVDSFLSISLFPGFTLYTLLGIVWFFPVLMLVLKLLGVVH